VNKLLADMLVRGLERPDCTAMFQAEKTPSIYMHWDEYGTSYGRTELGHGETIAEALESAKEIINGIPLKELRDKAEFTRMLADTIDKGRAIGIEVEFLNPLTATMKALSENIITDQREAKE